MQSPLYSCQVDDVSLFTAEETDVQRGSPIFPKHTALKWLSQNLNPGPSSCKDHALPLPHTQSFPKGSLGRRVWDASSKGITYCPPGANSELDLTITYCSISNSSFFVHVVGWIVYPPKFICWSPPRTQTFFKNMVRNRLIMDVISPVKMRSLWNTVGP